VKTCKLYIEPAPMPFIVGVGRSGTTLLRLLLDGHPDLAVTPETHWLVGAINKLLVNPCNPEDVKNYILNHTYWPDMGITNIELSRIFADYDKTHPVKIFRTIYQKYAKRLGKKRIGDKTPIHNLAMCEIAEMFPEAYFIHIIRDGRDVAVSYRDLWFGPGKDVKAAATMWVERIQKARQQSQFLPHYKEVRYEELVLSPVSVLKEISKFIDLPYNPVQLEYHKHANERLAEFQGISHNGSFVTMNERRELFKFTSHPPDKSRIGRWSSQMSSEDVQNYESIAGQLLSELGYPLATKG